MQKNWKELISPRGLIVDQETLSGMYGKFVAEPLEKGYAQTLGSSLRRILLSSLRGAAITSIRIEGILHEFGTISDVHEDVVDIVLNLKRVILNAHGEGPWEFKVKVKGESVVTAADIECPEGVEILNPDQVICHVGKGGIFDALVMAETGRSFRLADANKKPDQPIGEIAIDSLFSPITRVNFQVGSARVGQMTNFDKLTLEIWTNGTTRPEDALGIAARILQDQLSIFVNFDVDAVETELADTLAAGEVDAQFLRSIDALELSQRAINSLHNGDIELLGDLVQLKETELKEIKNFGSKSLEEVKAMLKEMDLTLGMKIPGWQHVVEQRNAS